jgi:hypothetical protein
MTTDNIKLAVECGASSGVRTHLNTNSDSIVFVPKDLNELITRVREEQQAKIAKLEQELCDMTFAYNACSHLLDKINK